ncbi:MAG: uncharacterized protein KVP18_001330 [Porospora cf. gigantea A]|uniref:uncharacterized protein n=1 Tax=Porospora cf. gigantea A TaxID=2853593 RepID=UPI00355A51B8|nr:MAG: hypothetical protein KVP18_001330 [Porospora cf. gigantea A]
MAESRKRVAKDPFSSWKSSPVRNEGRTLQQEAVVGQLKREMSEKESLLREALASLDALKSDMTSLRLQMAQSKQGVERELWMEEQQRSQCLQKELDGVVATVAVQQERIHDLSSGYTQATKDLEKLRRIVGNQRKPPTANERRGIQPRGASRASTHRSPARLNGGDPADVALYHVTPRKEPPPLRSASAASRPLERVALRQTGATRVATERVATERVATERVATESRCGPPLITEATSLETGTLDSLLRLLQRDSGILYRDQALEIGLALERREMAFVIHLYLGNLTPSPFSSLQTNLESQNPDSVPWEAVDNPTYIPPHGQVRQTFIVKSLAPFDFLPIFRIAFVFSDATAFRLSLHMPLAVSRFLEGWALDLQEIAVLWESTKFRLRHTTVCVPLRRDLESLLAIAQCASMSGALLLHEGVDDNETLVFVGCYPPSDVDYVEVSAVIAKVRLCSGRKLRVDVRSDSQVLATATSKLLSLLLGLPPSSLTSVY